MKIGYRFALMVSTAWSLAAQTYSIRMERRVPVGQTYAFSATGSSRQVVSSGDRTLQADEFRVMFEGQAKVLAVDKSGQPYQLSFTVQKFTRIQNGTDIAMLPPGSVLLADGSQKEHYSLRNGTLDKEVGQAFSLVYLDKEVGQAFSLVYSIHQPGSDNSDQIFGTKQARAVGESWPIDSALALKALQNSIQENSTSLKAEQVSGTTKFIDLDKMAGFDCAQLEAQITVGNFTMKSLARGIGVDRGTAQVEWHGCYPYMGISTILSGWRESSRSRGGDRA